MVELKINGNTEMVDVAGDTPLLWVLRDTLGLTGTKFGCGIAQCGACTVLLRGEPIRSCTTTVAAVQDGEVVTIEGLAGRETLHPLQKAWIEEDVPQCGYCQSGQIMAAAALLMQNPNPSETDINEAMAGILCRCGTYLRIRKAILRAAREVSP